MSHPTSDLGFDEASHARETAQKLQAEVQRLSQENWALKHRTVRDCLGRLQKTCFEAAKEKGWHEREISFPEALALMHSELSEALEEYRKPVRSEHPSYMDADTQPDKPSGMLVELADCVIRILDYCGSKDWDLAEAIEQKLEYNSKRPHRHGGKII